MPDTPFYAPTPTHNPLRWVLPVNRDICVGPDDRKFLFGGVGLASTVAAMEGSTGRNLVWATAQYLSYAQPDSIVDIDVRAPVVGKAITQARVVGHVGEREIFSVTGALGDRDAAQDRQLAAMPDVPAPQDCDTLDEWYRRPGDLHSRFEKRAIPRAKDAPEGRSRMWIKPQDGLAMTAGLLAVVADFVPGAIKIALDRPSGANSLDNTLRVHTLRPSEWLLCDTELSGIARGFVHGRMHIFTEDGTLLASASQSGILRVH